MKKTNAHPLNLSAQSIMVQGMYSRESRFQREFDGDAAELDCPAYTQELREHVIRLLAAKGVGVPGGKLEQLHKSLAQELKNYGYDDGVNRVSGFLYDTDEAFIKAYHHFIKTCVGSYFPYPFYFQATPTVRIHCPGGKNNHHYPRYHTDIGYGHPPEEINIWIPLTTTFAPQYHGFRRMDVRHSREVLAQFNFDFIPFIERAVNDKPYNHMLDKLAPQVTTPFGKMIAFDSRSIHTGESLMQHTRVSIDIRIIPVEDFKNLPVEYQGTGRRKIRFVPGQGYYRLSSEDL